MPARDRVRTAVYRRPAVFSATVWFLVVASLVALLTTRAADAALVRPLEGGGDFAGMLDVYERPGTDGTIDLVLIFAIPNRELVFRETWGGGLRGAVSVTAEATQPDGRVVARGEEMTVRVTRVGDAGSPTLYQIFTLVLEGLDAPYASLRCGVADLHGRRSEDEATGGPRSPTCMFEGEWVRAPAREKAVGLLLHDPLFLSGAPLGPLPEFLGDVPPEQRPSVAGHLHPTRRYGLEQGNLQVVFDVEAVRRGPEARDVLPHRLLVQVLSRELDLAYRDTLTVTDDPADFLARGGRATVGWRMPVDDLPPGSYQLSCAPLDGLGGSWIVEFDVLWSMAALVTPRAELELIGSLVFRGSARERFQAAGPVQREAMLGRFWEENDPDPSTTVNEAEVEYMARMRVVRHRYGGFGRRTVLDDRGMIYLLLGPPDEIEQQVVPVNSQSFEDAIAKVYDAYRPVRHGITDRPTIDTGVQPIQTDRELLARTGSFEKFKAYELWSYKENGRSLFPNQYEADDVGMRFLFLARLSGSTYTLETTNANDSGGTTE